MINQEEINFFIDKIQHFDYLTFLTSLTFLIPLTICITCFLFCLFLSISINKKVQYENPIISPYRYGYFVRLFFGLLKMIITLGLLVYFLVSETTSSILRGESSTKAITFLIIYSILFLIDIIKWILIFYRRHTGWIMLIVLQMLYLNIPCALINFIYYSTRSKNLNGSELS